MEEIGEKIILELWDETQSKNIKITTRSSAAEIMTWCNDQSDDERAIHHLISNDHDHNTSLSVTKTTPTTSADEFRTITCPSCGHHIQLQDQVFFFFFFCPLFVS